MKKYKEKLSNEAKGNQTIQTAHEKREIAVDS